MTNEQILRDAAQQAYVALMQHVQLYEITPKIEVAVDALKAALAQPATAQAEQVTVILSAADQATRENFEHALEILTGGEYSTGSKRRAIEAIKTLLSTPQPQPAIPAQPSEQENVVRLSFSAGEWENFEYWMNRFANNGDLPDFIKESWENLLPVQTAAQHTDAAPPIQPAQQRDSKDALLAEYIDRLLEYIDKPPDRNCSCHISPTCNDCTEHADLRELIDDSKAAIAATQEKTNG